MHERAALGTDGFFGPLHTRIQAWQATARDIANDTGMLSIEWSAFDSINIHCGQNPMISRILSGFYVEFMCKIITMNFRRLF